MVSLTNGSAQRDSKRPCATSTSKYAVTRTEQAALDALVDEPQPDEAETHEQLLNWAAWCRVYHVPGRARSAEGRFTPPASRLFDPPAPRFRVMLLAAEAVNLAMLDMPAGHREALHLRYISRMPDRVICRVLRLAVASYQRFMRDARLMLASLLLSAKRRDAA